MAAVESGRSPSLGACRVASAILAGDSALELPTLVAPTGPSIVLASPPSTPCPATFYIKDNIMPHTYTYCSTRSLVDSHILLPRGR